MHIGFIGPVREEWGGPPCTGGVSAYMQGLTSALANFDIQLSLLGDNTHADSWQNMAHLPGNLVLERMRRLQGQSIIRTIRYLGWDRLARMALRLITRPDFHIPWRQRLRYVDRSANYDRFLEESQPTLLHVAHAEFRQFLTQQIVGTSLPLIASVLSASVLLRYPPSNWLVKMTKQNFDRATRLLVCSNFVKETIAPYVNNPDKMVLVPNGIDPIQFHPTDQQEARRVLNLPVDAFIVLFTGALVLQKGVNLLLHAFAKVLPEHPNAFLIFVGKGPETSRIRKEAQELGIASRVILAGYRRTEELPHWYGACDVFALPSESEGLSISILEAMGCGRPIVTTYPGTGIHDAVEENVNGFLCHYGEVDALAVTLNRAMSQSPERLQEMGIASRHRVEQSFSWPVVAKKVMGVYQEVLVETRKSM